MDTLIGAQHTTGIADRVSTLISTPQRGDGSATVLAGDHDGGILTLRLRLEGRNIDGRWCIGRVVTAMLDLRRTFLRHSEICSF
jgi:hypothetical protein